MINVPPTTAIAEFVVNEIKSARTTDLGMDHVALLTPQTTLSFIRLVVIVTILVSRSARTALVDISEQIVACLRRHSIPLVLCVLSCATVSIAL